MAFDGFSQVVLTEVIPQVDKKAGAVTSSRPLEREEIFRNSHLTQNHLGTGRALALLNPQD
jgi:hypothetical protein